MAFRFKIARVFLAVIGALILLTMSERSDISFVSYHQMIVIGRWWSAMFSTLTIAALFILARRLYGDTNLALLAASFFAFAVISIQVAHFAVTESFITLMGVVIAILSHRIMKRGDLWSYLLAGAAMGTSLAAKSSALYYILFIAAGHLLYLSSIPKDDWIKSDFIAGIKGIRSFLASLIPLSGVVGTAALIFQLRRIISDIFIHSPQLITSVWIVISLILSAILLAALTQTLVNFRVLRGQLVNWGYLLAGVLFAFPFLFYLSPWTLLNYAAFSDAMTYEWRIVAHADAAYVLQFKDTTRYIFQLEQLVRVLLWYPLGLTALAGAVMMLSSIIKGFLQPVTQNWTLPVPLTSNYGFRFNKSDALVMSWFIAYFLFIGAWNTKFVRYMVPLVPFFCLFGACFIYRTSAIMHRKFKCSPIKPLLVGLILGASIFYALAFMNVYTNLHPWLKTSMWIYQNVPPGSTILREHWDDGMPTHLHPEMHPEITEFKSSEKYNYRTIDLTIYETHGHPTDESDVKKEYYAEMLGEGDYISISSKKLWYTLTAATPQKRPDGFNRYPVTSRYYRLLWSGQLGYRMVASFHNFPAFLGWLRPDDWAEESFSVYDHPRTYIFKKEKELDPAHIIDLLSSDKFVEGITRERMLEVTPAHFDEFVETHRTYLSIRYDSSFVHSAARTFQSTSSSLSVLRWVIILQLMGLICFILCGALLRDMPDNGYAVSKFLGFVIFSTAAWWAGSFSLISTRHEVLWFALIMFAVLAMYYSYVNYDYFKRLISARLNLILTSECLFLFVFGFVLLLRSFNPEIFWGEKPMNFSFLNYFIRLDGVPPDDPWSAGQPMKYYYLGSYFISLLHKLTGVSPGIGYNLSIATVAAFSALSLYALLLIVTRNNRWAAGGAVAVVFIGNLEVFYLLFFGERNVDFHLFWATSRLFTSPAITEFPLWSFLFGDLHAHVISLPIVATALAMLPAVLSLNKPSLSLGRFLLLILFALLIAVSFGANSWDALSLTLVTCSAFSLSILNSRNLHEGLIKLLLVFRNGIIITISSCILILPFLLGSTATGTIHYGVVHGDFDTAWQFFRHLGHWAAIIVASLLLMLLSPSAKTSSLFKQYILPVLAGLMPIIVGFWSSTFHQAGIPWGILLISSAAIMSGLSFYFNSDEREIQLPATLILASGLMIGLSQIFFLMDRMNTIFKFYNVVWLLLGISSIALLYQFKGSKWSRLFFSPPLLLLLLATMGSFVNMAIMTTHSHVQGPRPTLDGTAYLRVTQPEEAELIDWMNAYISGTPVTAEAHGPGYGPYTRITMHTGLPTVLGWEHHVYQRGTSREEIHRRREGLKLLYGPGNLDEIREFIKRYKVEYIVVGELERITYGPEHLKKFEESGDLFQPVFKNQGVALFKVVKH
jgi:YYY domain-containing protein